MRRILFVSKHYASNFSEKVGGVFQRMRMLLEGAAQASDALDILFFVDRTVIGAVDPAVTQTSLVRDWGIVAHVAFAVRAEMPYGRLVQTVRSLYDYRAQDDYFRFNGPPQCDAIRGAVEAETELLVAHRLYLGSAAVAARIASIPIVMDLDDIEHRKRQRELGPSNAQAARTVSRFARLELPSLKRGELATLRACKTSFVCSRSDQDYLAAAGVANTTVIPNAMRFPALPPAPSEIAGPDTLFFIGTYGYAANADAAEFLINSIFPLVLKIKPDVRLLIVGEAIEKLPSHARRPERVEFAGYVDDLATVYRRATIVCCPILSGGGTRIKIIEAAAAGKPVVSTTVGAEGLELVDGVEILLRDSAEAFARACVTLLDDPARAASMARAAFVKTRSKYERDAVVRRIAAAFREAAVARRA